MFASRDQYDAADWGGSQPVGGVILFFDGMIPSSFNLCCNVSLFNSFQFDIVAERVVLLRLHFVSIRKELFLFSLRLRHASQGVTKRVIARDVI